MEDDKKGKVIPLFSHTTQSQKRISKVGELAEASLSNGFVIFWDHDTLPYHKAGEFFRVLFSQGKVTILCENEEITGDSLLEVEDESGETFELPVEYFTRLLKRQLSSKIDDYDEFLMRLFSQKGIKVGMRAEDISVTRTELSDDEIDIYHPEKIAGFVKENGAFYVCELYHEKDGVIGYSEPYGFSSIDISLLDLMLTAFDDAEINGFNTTRASMDVSYFETNGTKIVTTISGEKLEEVIFSSLKRINALYTNTSFARAKSLYFESIVTKKLKEEVAY